MTILDKLGKGGNVAIVVAVAIAISKGIFRPIFTMMDKKQDPETKTYAAVREALTELVAVPVYIAIPLLIKKVVVGGLCNNKGLNEKELKKIMTNSKFIGVCAATLVIPAVCNVLQKPAMDSFTKWQDSKKPKKGLDINLDNDSALINQKNNQIVQKSEISNPVASTNKQSALDLYLKMNTPSNMRVGN